MIELIVLVLNIILTIAFVIATIWTAWGVHRLTQQIKRIMVDSKDTTDKDQ